MNEFDSLDQEQICYACVSLANVFMIRPNIVVSITWYDGNSKGIQRIIMLKDLVKSVANNKIRVVDI